MGTHGTFMFLGLFQSYIFRADKNPYFSMGHGFFWGPFTGQLMLEHFAKNRSSLKRLGATDYPWDLMFFDHATEMVLREIMFKRDKLR